MFEAILQVGVLLMLAFSERRFCSWVLVRVSRGVTEKGPSALPEVL